MTSAVLVGLHSLEAFEGVVKDAGCRVEREVLVRDYSRGEPAGRGSPFYREHMICRQLVVTILSVV